MNADQLSFPPTFGEFVAAVYDVSGKRRAKGIVRHAVNARLVEFGGDQRFVFSDQSPKAIYDSLNSVFEAPDHGSKSRDIRHRQPDEQNDPDCPSLLSTSWLAAMKKNRGICPYCRIAHKSVLILPEPEGQGPVQHFNQNLERKLAGFAADNLGGSNVVKISTEAAALKSSTPKTGESSATQRRRAASKVPHKLEPDYFVEWNHIGPGIWTRTTHGQSSFTKKFVSNPPSSMANQFSPETILPRSSFPLAHPVSQILLRPELAEELDSTPARSEYEAAPGFPFEKAETAKRWDGTKVFWVRFG